MEIIQNRYGVDRVIDKIGDNKIRVMGGDADTNTIFLLISY